MNRTRNTDVTIEITREFTTVIRVEGEVDMSNVHFLREAIDHTISDCSPGMVIDLTSLDFIDSSGIAAIVSTQHSLHENGRLLVLVTCNSNIKRTFSLIHLDSLPGLSLCDDMPAAARLFLAGEGGQ